MLTRRQFMLRGMFAGAAVSLPAGFFRTSVADAVPATAQLASYLTPFDVPRVVTLAPGADGTASYAFDVAEVTRTLHPALGRTRAWLYDDGKAGYSGYLSPILQIARGVPLQVSYGNALPAANYPPRIPVDRNLTDGSTEARILTHIHGGYVTDTADGNPAVSDSVPVGGAAQQALYPNDQRATLLWYHDHALGATRLNVYAGLAGGYLIRDAYDTGGGGVIGPNGDLGANVANPWLPVAPYEIPLVIQDRQFAPVRDANGFQDFLYPVMPAGMGTTGECGKPPNYYPGGTGPWIGEFFGDEMLVNGLCTPVLTVAPAVYRFRMLNGCNSRFLDLRFLNVGPGIAPPPTLTVIGTEQGLFRTPATGLAELPIVNGERADVIVDFRRHAGQDLVLRNTPLPKPYVSPGTRLQDVMLFRVRGTAGPAVTVPAAIAGGEDAGFQAGVVKVRRISLDEWNAGLPGWYVTLTPIDAIDPAAYAAGNVAPLPAVSMVTPATAACFHDSRAAVVAKGWTPEEPKVDTIEDWEFHNYTADTHPIHMHLTQFQLVDRRPLGTPPGHPATTGPLPFERGWNDTMAAHPGQVTRIRQRFSLPGGSAPQTYVYHCHIVEHEDNDMMRPFTVIP